MVGGPAQQVLTLEGLSGRVPQRARALGVSRTSWGQLAKATTITVTIIMIIVNDNNNLTTVNNSSKSSN